MVIDGYYCLLIAIHSHSCFLMVIVRDERWFINGKLTNDSFIIFIVHTKTTRWFNTSNVLKDMSIVAPFHPDHDTCGAQLTYLEVSYSNILPIHPFSSDPLQTIHFGVCPSAWWF